MLAPLDELATAVELATHQLSGAADGAVGAFVALITGVASVDALVAVGVIAPRCPRVVDLESRVRRRRYAQCADGHLVAGAVATASTRIGSSVVEFSSAEALRRAQDYFGFDRQTLGQQANAARSSLGPNFEYPYRLPALAAQVALGEVERADRGAARGELSP